MKITFDAQAGLYFAFCKINGKPCLGFSESRLDAMRFCYELVFAADTSSQERSKHD